MNRLYLLFAATIALSVACSSCATDGPGDKPTQSCTENSDCDPGFYCGDDDECAQDCDPSSADPGCADGETCDSLGRCVVEGECVIDDDCDDPPEESTCDGDALVGYSQVGTCDNENGETVCNYTETRTQCENGCFEGACSDDACAQVVCDNPPAAVCDDEMTLIEFSAMGTCSDGICDYMEVPTSCALGCMNGACEAGACEDEQCDMPPADECDNGTAITYADTGNCIDDEGTPICDYMPEYENCRYAPNGTCNNAACEGGDPQAGGILIREYMANPTGSFNDIAEWFEVVNVSGATVDLDGWKIQSGGVGSDEEHIITGPLTVDAGSTLLFARTDSVPFAYDYEYDGIALANNTDWLQLVNTSDEIVDYVFYESGAIIAGRSRKLDPSATQDVMANDDFANWCPSMGDEFTTSPSNYGTPGADNTACAADPCANFTCEAPRGFCVDGENKAVQYIDDNAMCQTSRFNNPYCDFDTMEVQCTDGAELCAFGACETIPDNVPAAGEVIITEFIPNPDGTDTDREWFEVYNTTGAEKSLFSVVFRNESGANPAEYQFFDPAITIGANEYLVFVRDTDETVNGGVVGGVEYSGGNLVNGASGADLLSLNTYDGTVIDAVPYDNPTDGSSFQLSSDSLDATANDDAANWCAATTSYGDGGNGSPGAANEACN